MTLNKDLADILNEAAADIVDYGWVARGADAYESDPLGTYPRCAWIAFQRVIQRSELSASQYIDSHDISEAALLEAAEVQDLNEFFRLNDSFVDRPEEGEEWAISVLEKAATIVDAVSEEKVADTVSTEVTDSGNATNVEGRQSFWQKLFKKG
jgi:hypothetical protein